MEGQPELNHKERACCNRYKKEIQKELRKVGLANKRIQAYREQLKAGRSVKTRALGILGVYMTVKEIAQISGVAYTEYNITERAVWTFVDEEGDAFIIMRRGRVFQAYTKEYVGGDVPSNVKTASGLAGLNIKQ